MGNERKDSLKKQLMAAIAMLMVAAVALTSATYAWFANNKTVEGKGMTVNAEAEASLLIAGSEDSNYTNYGSVGTNKLESLKMKPVTSYDGVYFAGLVSTAKVENSGSSVATDEKGNTLAAEDITTASSGWASCKYSLQSKGAKDGTATVCVDSITIDKSATTTSTSSMNKSIRIAVSISQKVGDKIEDVTYVYAPNMDENGTTLVGKYTTGTPGTWSLVAPSYDDDNDSATWTLTNGTAVDANIKIWFEGQDKDCFSDNILDKDWTIKIKFAKSE